MRNFLWPTIKFEIKSPVSALSITRPRSFFFGSFWDCMEAEAAWLLVSGAVAVDHAHVGASPMAARPTAPKSFNSRNRILKRFNPTLNTSPAKVIEVVAWNASSRSMHCRQATPTQGPAHEIWNWQLPKSDLGAQNLRTHENPCGRRARERAGSSFNPMRKRFFFSRPASP